MQKEQWAYTGECFISENNSGTCDLCGQQNLKYIFQIENVEKTKYMSVGSECILDFMNSGYMKKETGNGEQVFMLLQQHKREKIEEEKRKQLFQSIDCIHSFDESFKPDHYYALYYNQGGFTPNQAVYILEQIQHYHIPYQTSSFTILLRKKEHQEELMRLSFYYLELLWMTLSSEQQKKFQYLYEQKKE